VDGEGGGGLFRASTPAMANTAQEAALQPSTHMNRANRSGYKAALPPIGAFLVSYWESTALMWHIRSTSRLE
jgi:hypothetical protein